MSKDIVLDLRFIVTPSATMMEILRFDHKILGSPTIEPNAIGLASPFAELYTLGGGAALYHGKVFEEMKMRLNGFVLENAFIGFPEMRLPRIELAGYGNDYLGGYVLYDAEGKAHNIEQSALDALNSLQHNTDYSLPVTAPKHKQTIFESEWIKEMPREFSRNDVSALFQTWTAHFSTTYSAGVDKAAESINVMNQQSPVEVWRFQMWVKENV